MIFENIISYFYTFKKSNTKDTFKKSNTKDTFKKSNTKDTFKKSNTKYKKKKIPKALREQVWINRMGKHFSGTCSISWCENDINCFNFDCGHNIPESKGGPTNLENLIPICRNCNIGMGNRFTIDEWDKKYKVPLKWYQISYWK